MAYNNRIRRNKIPDSTDDGLYESIMFAEQYHKEQAWKSDEDAFKQLSGQEQAVLMRMVVHGSLLQALRELGLTGKRAYNGMRAFVHNKRYMAAKAYVFKEYTDANTIVKEIFENELTALALVDIGVFTETIEIEETKYDNKTKTHEFTGNMVWVTRFKLMDDIPDYARKAIESIELEDGRIKKLKLYNKITAIESLAKMRKWIGTQEATNDLMSAKLNEIAKSASDIAESTTARLQLKMNKDGSEILNKFDKTEKKV